MIGTYIIKQQQLKNGFFQSGSGPYKILIQGSCRVVPLVDYFDKFNDQNGNQLTIYSIDPFNFNWNMKDERVDYESALRSWEDNDRMLNMLSSVDCYIHEFYRHSGMFNVDKNESKNIYQFGINPKIDICTPNFNDVFILMNDILTFDSEMRKKVLQDMNVLSKISTQTKEELFNLSVTNLHRFYEVCRKSDIPELVEYFSANMRGIRFFHTYNHVSKFFTLFIFRRINERWLNLKITPEFMHFIAQHDMFDNSYTKLTNLDIELYGMNWNEEIVPLNI